MFFGPLLFLFMLGFFFLLVFLFVFVQIGIIGFAFDKIGISPALVFTLLFACLIGSYINIPIRRIRNEEILRDQVVSFFGFRFRVPVPERQETVIALNLGGAIIPCLIAAYLLLRTAYPLAALVGVAIVAGVSRRVARPVPGMGIALPAFIPPIVAALVALLLAPSQSPMVAYVSGTFGVLIGADLLNLNRVQRLQAPVVSIGGAGTFDGIFLTGIIAVLLA